MVAGVPDPGWIFGFAKSIYRIVPIGKRVKQIPEPRKFSPNCPGSVWILNEQHLPIIPVIGVLSCQIVMANVCAGKEIFLCVKTCDQSNIFLFIFWNNWFVFLPTAMTSPITLAGLFINHLLVQNYRSHRDLQRQSLANQHQMPVHVLLVRSLRVIQDSDEGIL